jgi:hypothetical protein
VLAARGIPFEVFVIGNSIGEWNDFDPSEPRTRHMRDCDLDSVVSNGGRLQWHSRSHPHLPHLADETVATELLVPEPLQRKYPPPHFCWFSYPGGAHDDRAVNAARQTFSGAVSVIEGDPGDRWRLNRLTVNQDTLFSTLSIEEFMAERRSNGPRV